MMDPTIRPIQSKAGEVKAPAPASHPAAVQSASVSTAPQAPAQAAQTAAPAAAVDISELTAQLREALANLNNADPQTQARLLAFMAQSGMLKQVFNFQNAGEGLKPVLMEILSQPAMETNSTLQQTKPGQGNATQTSGDAATLASSKLPGHSDLLARLGQAVKSFSAESFAQLFGSQMAKTEAAATGTQTSALLQVLGGEAAASTLQQAATAGVTLPTAGGQQVAQPAGQGTASAATTASAGSAPAATVTATATTAGLDSPQGIQALARLVSSALSEIGSQTQTVNTQATALNAPFLATTLPFAQSLLQTAEVRTGATVQVSGAADLTGLSDIEQKLDKLTQVVQRYAEDLTANGQKEFAQLKKVLLTVGQLTQKVQARMSQGAASPNGSSAASSDQAAASGSSVLAPGGQAATQAAQVASRGLVVELEFFQSRTLSSMSAVLDGEGMSVERTTSTDEKTVQLRVAIAGQGEQGQKAAQAPVELKDLQALADPKAHTKARQAAGGQAAAASGVQQDNGQAQVIHFDSMSQASDSGRADRVADFLADRSSAADDVRRYDLSQSNLLQQQQPLLTHMLAFFNVHRQQIVTEEKMFVSDPVFSSQLLLEYKPVETLSQSSQQISPTGSTIMSDGQVRSIIDVDLLSEEMPRN